jgi:AraC family transcriptional regulator of adaptative response/methylated-DNA-[protein]-cysteine methyltransferase
VRIGKVRGQVLEELQREFHRAELVETSERVAGWMQDLVTYLEGSRPWPELPLDVRATAFQAMVWETLRKIPEGTTASYGQIAVQIGRPTAARAVAQACATNPVALVIPCHRVVPAAGGAGGYRWGVEVKKTLLELEAGSTRQVGADETDARVSKRGTSKRGTSLLENNREGRPHPVKSPEKGASLLEEDREG